MDLLVQIHHRHAQSIDGCSVSHIILGRRGQSKSGCLDYNFPHCHYRYQLSGHPLLRRIRILALFDQGFGCLRHDHPLSRSRARRWPRWRQKGLQILVQSWSFQRIQGHGWCWSLLRIVEFNGYCCLRLSRNRVGRSYSR